MCVVDPASTPGFSTLASVGYKNDTMRAFDTRQRVSCCCFVATVSPTLVVIEELHGQEEQELISRLYKPICAINIYHSLRAALWGFVAGC